MEQAEFPFTASTSPSRRLALVKPGWRVERGQTRRHRQNPPRLWRATLDLRGAPMQSTLTSRPSDPHDIFVVEPDVVLATRGDQTTDLAQEILSRSSAPQAIKGRLEALAEIASGVAAGAAPPSVDTTFRAADVSDIRKPDPPPSGGRWARRVFMALFAIGSAAAAVAWQNYGDTAKQVIANFVPPFALAASPSPQQPASADQTGATEVQSAATEQAAAQPVPRAQTAPADVAALAPEQTPLLQSMARDLAAMGQQIEQLKVSIEQLRNSQQQMARDIVKSPEARNSAAGTTEPAPRPRLSTVAALPPRAAAAPVRRPRPASFSPAPLASGPAMPQAAAAPAPSPPEPPSRLMVEPDGEPVVRPPMPLR
jgi:hypothetical protein